MLADPAAVGADDPAVLSALDTWMRRLRGYLEAPPATEGAWASYETFVRTVIRNVFMFVGR